MTTGRTRWSRSPPTSSSLPRQASTSGRCARSWTHGSTTAVASSKASWSPSRATTEPTSTTSTCPIPRPARSAARSTSCRISPRITPAGRPRSTPRASRSPLPRRARCSTGRACSARVGGATAGGPRPPPAGCCTSPTSLGLRPRDPSRPCAAAPAVERSWRSIPGKPPTRRSAPAAQYLGSARAQSRHRSLRLSLRRSPVVSRPRVLPGAWRGTGHPGRLHRAPGLLDRAQAAGRSRASSSAATGARRRSWPRSSRLPRRRVHGSPSGVRRRPNRRRPPSPASLRGSGNSPIFLAARVEPIPGWLHPEAALLTAHMAAAQHAQGVAGPTLEDRGLQGQVSLGALPGRTARRGRGRRGPLHRRAGLRAIVATVRSNVAAACGEAARLRIVVADSLELTSERVLAEGDGQPFPVREHRWGTHAAAGLPRPGDLRPVLRDGGIIALDDIFNFLVPGVMEGINAFFLQRKPGLRPSPIATTSSSSPRPISTRATSARRSSSSTR